MKKIRVAQIAAIPGIAALIAAGCGGADSDTNTSAATAAAAQSTSGGAVAVSFDQAFIDAMVPHHEQAIEMAQAAQTAGLDQPDLVAIADAIIATQQAEIDQMLAWREQWFGSPTVDLDAAQTFLGLSMAEMGMDDDMMEMLGMDEINGAFASAMTAHHEGAITMAELALEQSERPEIRDLAGRIIEAQEDEISTMADHMGMQHG